MKHLTRALAALAALFAISSGARMQDPEPPTTRVEVIAHRGASLAAPENTLAAFRLAREIGADWFELDCMLCKSGEVVVMHDATVDRTTNGSGNVADLTLDELRALDAGKWKGAKFEGERVPTLAEALELTGPGCGCYIEVKSFIRETGFLSVADGKLTRDAALDAAFLERAKDSPDTALARSVVAVVRQSGKSKHVVIQSFSPVVCAVVAIEAPELRVELLGSGRTAEAWEGYYRWALLFGFHGVNTSLAALNESRLGVVRATGMTCAVYTVNRAEDMARLAAWGVTGLITDDPELCLSELKRHGFR